MKNKEMINYVHKLLESGVSFDRAVVIVAAIFEVSTEMVRELIRGS